MIERKMHLVKDKKQLLEYLHNGSWYHTIKFSDSLKSNGVYDVEKYLPLYGFPEDLTGKKVLDVGCADGFFAFEFEKRNASSILAVDTNKFDGRVAIDPSPSKREEYTRKYENFFVQNNKFLKLAQNLGLKKVHHILIAKKLLNSKVKYKDCSIYNLEKLNEKFDFIFCGDLVEHLKNPIEAMEQLRKACKDTCIISLSSSMELPRVLSWINVIPKLKDRLITYHGDSGGTFFHFHPETFKKLLLACGFRDVKIYSKFNMINKKYGVNVPHVIYHCKID